MKGTTNGQKRGRARFLVIDGYHQAGRAELGEDTFGPNYSEMHVELAPLGGRAIFRSH